MGISIFSYIIMLLGFLFIVLGFIIWKKQKLTFIYGCICNWLGALFNC